MLVVHLIFVGKFTLHFTYNPFFTSLSLVLQKPRPSLQAITEGSMLIEYDSFTYMLALGRKLNFLPFRIYIYTHIVYDRNKDELFTSILDCIILVPIHTQMSPS